MGFFGIGTEELILILLLILIIFGPGRLSEIARTLGKAARALRKASSDFTTAITKEMEEEKKSPVPAPTEQIKARTCQVALSPSKAETPAGEPSAESPERHSH